MEHKINEFINIFKEKILENINNIIGIYIFGSLVYGGFDEKSSDIDLQVITKALLNEEEMEKIKNVHKEIIEINKIWGKRLEVSYTPLFMFKEKVIPVIPRPYYNGKFYEKAGYGNEWIINNYLILNYGQKIYGEDFKTLLNYEISIDNVKKSCVKDFYKEWNPKIKDEKWLLDYKNQAYIILNICRIIYTIKNNKIGNKLESAKWVKEKYIKWNSLIEEAEKWDLNIILSILTHLEGYA